MTYDVVAITDGTGAVVERFLYDPYDKSTVLDANFAFDSDGLSDYDWETRFTSREFDKETGLDYFRARYYHSGVGRFVNRDPLEYPDGMNAYAGYFVPGGVDPDGLKSPYAPPPIDGYGGRPIDYGSTGTYCEEQAEFWKSLMNSEHEKLAWNRFVNGNGEDLTLSGRDMSQILDNFIRGITDIRQKLQDAAANCTPPDETVFYYEIGDQFKRSIGGIDSLRITGSACHDEMNENGTELSCYSFRIIVQDKYDFDWKAFGRRKPHAELAVRGIWLDQQICGWKSFTFTGSDTGKICVPKCKYHPPAF